MNEYHKSTVYFMNLHGSDCSYVREIEGTYDVNTSSTTNTTITTTHKMYKKHYQANQYNSPHLIGKDVAVFYLSAYGLSFIPVVQDKIVISGKTYKVQSITEHRAQGEVILYKILSVAQ